MRRLLRRYAKNLVPSPHRRVPFLVHEVGGHHAVRGLDRVAEERGRFRIGVLGRDYAAVEAVAEELAVGGEI
ncbi:hypothetical protein ACWEO2_44080 [Nocardia sp. NPDC004278]